MADEPTTPAVEPETPKVEENKGTPAISPDELKGKSPDEIVKFVAEKAEGWGKQRAEYEKVQDWAKKVAPYIDAITADKELEAKVEEAYRKKYNITTKDEPKNEEPSEQDRKLNDTRKTLENQIMGAFEQKHGLDKLQGEEKQAMNLKVGQQLARMLDPGGTKSYDQLIADVSLENLAPLMEDAYFLATKDDQIKKAREAGATEAQSGAAGVIGSIPSSSPDASDMALTPDERAAAKALGIDEAKYLERKKQINARNAGR